jgi:hypothetical protein
LCGVEGGLSRAAATAGHAYWTHTTSCAAVGAEVTSTAASANLHQRAHAACQGPLQGV